MITLARHGFVAEIVLDRPQAHNALSTEMASRLASVCAEVAASDARAVVLSSSAPRSFCVGADLKERASMTDADLMRQRTVFRAAFGGVLNLPQPVVAAVHGFALGGGTEFALSCDLIVADPTSVFGLPEVGIGLIPAGGGTQLLQRRVGTAKAADLIFTGRKVGFDEAVALGLVDRSAPEGGDRSTALELAEAIAANSPVALRAAKRALRHGAPLDLAAALDVEDSAWRTAVLSDDRREGIAAFNEKRRPNWPGV
jgi:enoyl-CoA hydratase/carnithine racemase